MDGPKWQQADSIIGVNPGVGLRPRNTDARIDSQMFVLEQGDTNTHMSEHEGEGDLNADYVARAEKFPRSTPIRTWARGRSLEQMTWRATQPSTLPSWASATRATTMASLPRRRATRLSPASSSS